MKNVTKERKTNAHYVIHTKIPYDVKEIKKHHSLKLMMWLFALFCLFTLVTELVVGKVIAEDYRGVVNAILYLLLYILICVISFLIKSKAKKDNGTNSPFEAKELENITLKSLVLTGIFFFVFSEKEMSTSSVALIGVLLPLLLGFIFSLNEGLRRDDISGLLEYLGQAIAGFVSSWLDSVWIIAITAVPMTAGIEFLVEKRKPLFWVIYGSVFLFAMILWLLNGISYALVLKHIKRKIIDQNVLILDYSRHRILTTKIVELVMRTKDDYKEINKGKIFSHQYDVIIIVDELAHQTKLLTDAKACLAEDGVIIAPAYTARKKKSELISINEYKEKIIKQGMSVSKILSYGLIGVTYMEIKKKSKDKS